MIDEKKLIDELKQSGMIVDNEYGNAMVDFIESQPKMGEWIPVSERLPEEPENTSEYVESDVDDGIIKEYIVQIENASTPTCLYYAGKGRWWDQQTYEFYKVIAWQPLPEPYKEECNE